MELVAEIDWTGRKVIVTGGAGFVGSHLCESLLAAGADVVCMDDLSAGKESNVAAWSRRNNFRFVKMDVCEKSEAMDRLFEGVDTVFHNAASKKNICLIDPGRDLESMPAARSTCSSMPSSLGQEVRPCLDRFGLWRAGRLPDRRDPSAAPGLLLRRLQAGRRALCRRVQPPLRPRHDHPALFPRLRAAPGIE
jgi:hypothetical protein